jgi:NAD(P)-dependent dehydrogenase (short-subunit alcohol dehydrogenase family)
MSGRLDGKVAIVTGAALTDDGLNIGGATAAEMAREGARVVAADRNLAGAERLAEEVSRSGGEVVACYVNIGEEESLRALIATAVKRFGRLDIMHNNATAVSNKDHDLLTTTAAMWERMFRINVLGYALGCKFAVAQMLDAGTGGSVINTSSTSALLGMPSRIAYGASKAAINNLTLNIATQYGKYGVRCNAICPGLTLSAGALSTQPGPVLDIYRRHTLTNQLGEPQHIAEMAVFLASDAAAFVTGQIIKVDGGLQSHAATFADLSDLPNAGNTSAGFRS